MGTEEVIFDELTRHDHLPYSESITRNANCECGWRADGFGPFDQFDRHLREAVVRRLLEESS